MLLIIQDFAQDKDVDLRTDLNATVVVVSEVHNVVPEEEPKEEEAAE